MAQIFVSDEQLQSLTMLAQQRSMSPEQLLAALITQLEQEDRATFWREDVIADLRCSLADNAAVDQFLNKDAFFAELAAIS